MVTITKKELMELGYGSSFSTNIIRQAKQLMITNGYAYYQSRKLNRVPVKAVEEILGITFQDEKNTSNCTSCKLKGV